MAITAATAPSPVTWNTCSKPVNQSDQTVPDLVDADSETEESTLSQSMAHDIWAIESWHIEHRALYPHLPGHGCGLTDEEIAI